MLAHPTSVTRLLQIYHGGKAAAVAPTDLPNIKQVNFLCAIGLGPIAFATYGDAFKNSNRTLFSVLRSADLTTRAIYGQLEKATVELARELQCAGIIPTFLKGISTSQEFYTPPYLRVMSDIDILIQRSEVDRVMGRIADLGYAISDKQWRTYGKNMHHHLPEARHPETGMCIEVHTGLFSEAEFYSGEPVFQPDNIAQQSVTFDFNGTRAARFTPEFQFVFTVSKWSVDRDWAVNMKNINDVIHILRKYESGFDWPTLSKWFAASPHLSPIITPLLQYLEQAELVTVSPQMRAALARHDCKPGSRSLQVLSWLLHTYLFNARDKVHTGYAKWCARAVWLYLTKPADRNLGIPRALRHELYLSALYGKYNPLGRVLARLNHRDDQ